LSISINSKILEQIQGYNLHFRDTIISSNYMEVLALHVYIKEVENAFLLRFVILHTGNSEPIILQAKVIERRI
jgi:hypothetical protein